VGTTSGHNELSHPTKGRDRESVVEVSRRETPRSRPRRQLPLRRRHRAPESTSRLELLPYVIDGIAEKRTFFLEGSDLDVSVGSSVYARKDPLVLGWSTWL